MFIFVAVAMASCGDDDKDEPDLPDASFLCGTWEYSPSWQHTYFYYTIVLSPDGSFNAQIRRKVYQSSEEYVLIGSWTYKNGKLSIKYSAYVGDSLYSKSEMDYDIFYDEHINKLIISSSADYRELSLSGQYVKAN